MVYTKHGSPTEILLIQNAPFDKIQDVSLLEDRILEVLSLTDVM